MSTILQTEAVDTAFGTNGCFRDPEEGRDAALAGFRSVLRSVGVLWSCKAMSLADAVVDLEDRA